MSSCYALKVTLPGGGSSDVLGAQTREQGQRPDEASGLVCGGD